jgi:hypothetical protein
MNISAQAVIATIKLNLLRRPLLHAETIKDVLDIKRNDLMAMIESGELAWAWDIGLSPRNQEVRILAHCLCERQFGPLAGIGATKNLALPEVLKLFLPQTRSQLRGRELQRLLGCTPDQLRKLSQAGELTKVEESLPTDGPLCSPHFTRESVVKFFARRRIE